MSQTERSGPRPEAAPTNTTWAEDNQRDEASATAARYPSDPARRLHWHHRLVRQRRWSAELDRLLADELTQHESATCCGFEDQPGDYWHDVHMDLGVPERDRAGRTLLAAGWLPGLVSR